MIKKASHIFLSMLLFLSTTGLAISKHFCGGELISTALYVEADSCCDSDDCCNNETEVFQLNEDFSVSAALELPESVTIDLFAFPLVVMNISIEGNTLSDKFLIADSQSPPKIQTSLAKRQSYLL